MTCPAGCLLTALARNGCATDFVTTPSASSQQPSPSQISSLVMKCCRINAGLKFPPDLSSCAEQSACQQTLPVDVCANIQTDTSVRPSIDPKLSLNPTTTPSDSKSNTAIQTSSKTLVPSRPSLRSSIFTNPQAIQTPSALPMLSGGSTVTAPESTTPSTVISSNLNTISGGVAQPVPTTASPSPSPSPSETSDSVRATAFTSLESTGTSSPSAQRSPTQESVDNSHHTVNTRAIAGGVIGGIICIVLIILGLWLVRSRAPRVRVGRTTIRTLVNPFMEEKESGSYTPTSPDMFLQHQTISTPTAITPFLLITASASSPHEDISLHKQRPSSTILEHPVFRQPSSESSSATETRLMSSVASLRRHLDAIRREPSQAISSVISRASTRRASSRVDAMGNTRPPTEATRTLQEEMAAIRAQMRQLQSEQRSSADSRFTMEGMLRTMTLMQAEIDELRTGHGVDAETLPSYAP